jgi:peptidoglycan hydrolase-like protein with peptidoglycan-binding domain
MKKILFGFLTVVASLGFVAGASAATPTMEDYFQILKANNLVSDSTKAVFTRDLWRLMLNDQSLTTEQVSGPAFALSDIKMNHYRLANLETQITLQGNSQSRPSTLLGAYGYITTFAFEDTFSNIGGSVTGSVLTNGVRTPFFKTLTSNTGLKNTPNSTVLKNLYLAVSETFVGSTTPGTTTINSSTFQHHLTMGSNGADVKVLQDFLIAKGFLTVSGGSTTYFGSQTRDALKAYQISRGISPANGYFGTITRAAVLSDAPAVAITTPNTTTPPSTSVKKATLTINGALDTPVCTMDFPTSNCSNWWKIGESKAITWATENIASSQKAKLTLIKNDNSEIVIANNVSNRGTYNWKPTQTAGVYILKLTIDGVEARAEIQIKGQTSSSDTTTATTTNSLSLVTPTSDTYKIGSVLKFKWEYQTATTRPAGVNSMSYQYGIKDVNGVETILQKRAAVSRYTYRSKIPKDITPGVYKTFVREEWAGGNTVYGQDITIVSATTVTPPESTTTNNVLVVSLPTSSTYKIGSMLSFKWNYQTTFVRPEILTGPVSYLYGLKDSNGIETVLQRGAWAYQYLYQSKIPNTIAPGTYKPFVKEEWVGGNTVYGQDITIVSATTPVVTPPPTVAATSTTSTDGFILTTLTTGQGTVTGNTSPYKRTSVASPKALVTAVPATGYKLGSWVGCKAVIGTMCYVDMTSNKTVTANFVAN